MDWLADLYVNILNLIHYMHDKYYYEAAEMALIELVDFNEALSQALQRKLPRRQLVVAPRRQTLLQ